VKLESVSLSNNTVKNRIEMSVDIVERLILEVKDSVGMFHSAGRIDRCNKQRSPACLCSLYGRQFCEN